MGIVDKIAPEKAKLAIAIATVMAKRCHDCPNSKLEKCIMYKLKVPNMESEECIACLNAIKGGCDGVNG